MCMYKDPFQVGSLSSPFLQARSVKACQKLFIALCALDGRLDPAFVREPKILDATDDFVKYLQSTKKRWRLWLLFSRLANCFQAVISSSGAYLLMNEGIPHNTTTSHLPKYRTYLGIIEASGERGARSDNLKEGGNTWDLRASNWGLTRVTSAASSFITFTIAGMTYILQGYPSTKIHEVGEDNVGSKWPTIIIHSYQ